MNPKISPGIENNDAYIDSNTKRFLFLNPNVLNIANSYVLSSTSDYISEKIKIKLMRHRKNTTIKKKLSIKFVIILI